MTTVRFITILPNIWLTYFEIPAVRQDSDIANISATIKKFSLERGIQKMVRCDKDINYWNKSETYIADIKSQMILDEINMLVKYYNSKISEIHENYTNHQPTLIISHSHLEIVIGLLVMFMKRYCNMEINEALNIVKDKLSIHHIVLSDSMIRLLQMAKTSS